MTQTLTKDLVVLNRSGIHARPSTLIVQESQKFKSNILLRHGSVVADCRSVLDLLSLAACSGAELTLEVTGEDAEEALEKIVALFDDRFNEDNGGKLS